MTSNEKVQSLDPLFTQDIEETTQPEKVTELVKQSMKEVESMLKESGFVVETADDGSKVWTYDENVEEAKKSVVDKALFRVRVFGLDTDIEDLDYGAIVQRLVNAQEIMGMFTCEVVIQGSQTESETHSIRIERHLGTAPFIIPRKYGSFSGLQLSGVKSLVLVYPLNDRQSFICALANLTVEKHETWCLDNGEPPVEIIHLTAGGALPWSLV